MSETVEYKFGRFTLSNISGNWEIKDSEPSGETGKKTFELNPDQLNLLVLLIQNYPNLVDKQLYELTYHENISPDTFKKRIQLIREYLGDYSDSPVFIKTEINKGYKWINSETVKPADIFPKEIYDLLKRKYPDYMSDIEQHVNTRKNDAEKDPNWLVSKWKVALAGISLKREKRINTKTGKEEFIISVDVKIPTNPYVAYNVEDDFKLRDYMEGHGKDKNASHPAREEIQKFMDGEINEVLNFPARFSQGGSLTVLWVPTEDAYKQLIEGNISAYKLNEADDYGDFEPFVLVARKRVGESIHGKYLRASSGLAEDPGEDWTEPSLVIVTECFQKMKICDNDNEEVRYIPTTIAGFERSSPSLTTRDVERKLTTVIKGRRNYLRKQVDKLTERTKNCDAWYEFLGNDEIFISYLGSHHGPIKGCVALDPKYGAIDFMGSINLRIMNPLSKLKIYDDENKDSDFNSQPVLVFKKDQFANIFKGEKARAERFFGFEQRELHEGESAILNSVSMNPPLFWAGLALLEKLGITFSEEELRKAKDKFKKDLEDRSEGVKPKFDEK